MTPTDSPTSGFDNATLDAQPDQALACLARAGAQASELIEEWIRRPNPLALSMVAEKTTGGSRRQARRGLNVLRSRGVTVPVTPQVSTLASSPQISNQVEAWMTPPDASGAFVIMIASSRPGRNLKAGYVFFHAEIGIQKVEAAEQSRSQMRQSLTKLLPHRGATAVSVPVDWARYRIDRARARHQQLAGVPPLGWSSIANLAEPVPTEAPLHPLDGLKLAIDPEAAREAAAASATLHRLPEFQAWLPPRTAVDAMLAQVGENLEPGTEPPADKMGPWLDTAVRAATDRLFQPPVREQLVSIMKDSALSIMAREGQPTIERLWATMDRITAAGLITDPPSEIGFLRGFFEKALAVLASEGKGSLKIPVRQRPVSDAQARDPGDIETPTASSELGGESDTSTP